MSTEEALKNIDDLLLWAAIDAWGDNTVESLIMSKEALESKSEAEEYRTPKEPVYKGYGYNNCPTCGRVLVIINPDKKFCPYCGQALDWSVLDGKEVD